MKKYFIVSDTHGFYDELIKSLNDNNFDINNKEHILILCGDAFDRGQQAVALFNFIKELKNQDRLIYIKGNHESLLFDCVHELKENEGCASSHHYSNGTVDTVIQLEEANILNEVLQFIEDVAINYYETNNYIFVHGYIPFIDINSPLSEAFGIDLPAYNPDWRNVSEEDWEKARWVNGMQMNNWDIVEPNKTIICGHWHCSWGNHYLNSDIEEFPKDEKDFDKSFKTYMNKGIIAIDACTVYSHRINVLVLKKNEM